MSSRRRFRVGLQSLAVAVGGAVFGAAAWGGGTLASVPGAPPAAAPARPRPIRLAAVVNLAGLLWGAECREPEDRGLAFGGEDPTAEDGCGHTRVLENGAWKDIRADLEARNVFQPLAVRAAALRTGVKDTLAAARRVFFEGLPAADEAARVRREVAPRDERALKDLETLIADVGKANTPGEREQGQRAFALPHLRAAEGLVRSALAGVEPAALKARDQAAIRLGLAAEALGTEPPPRALSPIAFDARTGLYVLFGGDHLDYLTNDTWVFDPAKRVWSNRHPATAPSPRAGHTLAAAGDGKITLTGGYTYTSSTDYCGAQYAELGDGPWTYNLETNAWTGVGTAVASDTRTYRTGPFYPDFFYQGPKPNRAAAEERLQALPANTWVALNPPWRPRLDRVWGTAVLDPDRDLILVWGGGHSSHGGSDVLHYHPATNRWELPYPVEFPLGQLYSNTSYPDSFNFNRRPWPTGHTYRSYAYDTVSKRLIFAGHTRHQYVYDPDVADWVGRAAKPRQLAYPGCFYDLTLCTTPAGVVAWGGYYGRAEYSKISRFDPTTGWGLLALAGDTLKGSVCDNCCLVYDSKRDRLLAFVREKDGCTIQAVDLKTLAVKTLAPAGAAASRGIAFWREFCYDAAHDLVLGTTLPPDTAGVRRTAAYDCANNRWVSLRIGGSDPSGKDGRNVSLGLLYDPKRSLIWGMDNYHLQVYALRLDPVTADLRPLP